MPISAVRFETLFLSYLQAIFIGTYGGMIFHMKARNSKTTVIR